MSSRLETVYRSVGSNEVEPVLGFVEHWISKPQEPPTAGRLQHGGADDANFGPVRNGSRRWSTRSGLSSCQRSGRNSSGRSKYSGSQ